MFLERVEDEVEAVLERGRDVVADFGDVPGDHFGEVGKLVGKSAHLPLVRKLGELPDLLLRDGRGFLGGLERDALFLEREAVDVRVLDGVRVDGQLDREASFSEATEDGVVESQAGGSRRHARLHQADGPAVTGKHFTG